MDGDHCDVGGGWYADAKAPCRSNIALSEMLKHCGPMLGISMPAYYPVTEQNGKKPRTHSILKYTDMDDSVENIAKWMAYNVTESSSLVQYEKQGVCSAAIAPAVAPAVASTAAAAPTMRLATMVSPASAPSAAPTTVVAVTPAAANLNNLLASTSVEA